jgi:hypothetical protein
MRHLPRKLPEVPAPGRRFIVTTAASVAAMAVVSGLTLGAAHSRGPADNVTAADSGDAVPRAQALGLLAEGAPQSAEHTVVPPADGSAPHKAAPLARHDTPPSKPHSEPAQHGEGTSSVPHQQYPKTPSPSASKASPTASVFHVGGQVSCRSGGPVVGVWVQTTRSADARFADWKPVGSRSTANWSTSLPRNESYSLHVGCGGTPAKWSTSDTTGVFSGASNSFSCDDVAGDRNYLTCAHR